jgi:hypothetical protein
MSTPHTGEHWAREIRDEIVAEMKFVRRTKGCIILDERI